jgi:hypothetical protein
MRLPSRFPFGLLLTLPACAASRRAPPLAAERAAASPRASAVAPPAGGAHDFDFFAGGWTTRQRRLKVRGAGADDWEEFPGTLCMTPYLDGRATVDELVFPTKGWAGMTVRLFDVEKRQWSIYWVSSRTGRLGTPVVGGFRGARGEFYGDDEDGGRAVRVRYAWTKLDADHARWEQAFSYDGKAWEVNWTADFVRADPAAVCAGGRPRG